MIVSAETWGALGTAFGSLCVLLGVWIKNRVKRDSTMLEHEDAFMTKQTDMIDRLDKSLKEISDKNTQLMDQLADVSSKYEIISVQYKTINEQNKKIMTENQELRMQVGLLNDLVKRLNTDLLAMGGHDYSDKIEEISST